MCSNFFVNWFQIRPGNEMALMDGKMVKNKWQNGIEFLEQSWQKNYEKEGTESK